MGCCISRPSGPNSPYPGGIGASTSARAINRASPPSAGAASVASGGGAPHPSAPSSISPGAPPRRAPPHHSLAQIIDRPLRLHEWTSQGRTWTPAALRRERAEYFDTRVSGRQEIWQTLRTALELLWEAQAARWGRIPRQGGDAADEGTSENEGLAAALATAQTIISAADITLPSGDLAQGAYDAFGNYYPLPEHVVSDPENIMVEDHTVDKDRGLADAKDDLTGGDDDTAEDGELDEDDDDDDDEEMERRREEKGKAVVDARDQIVLRARLSDGSRDVKVAVGKDDSVRSIARRIAEEAKLPQTKKVRVAYMGKILKEGSPLPAQGWKAGHTLNALVFPR